MADAKRRRGRPIDPKSVKRVRWMIQWWLDNKSSKKVEAAAAHGKQFKTAMDPKLLSLCQEVAKKNPSIDTKSLQYEGKAQLAELAGVKNTKPVKKKTVASKKKVEEIRTTKVAPREAKVGTRVSVKDRNVQVYIEAGTNWVRQQNNEGTDVLVIDQGKVQISFDPVTS